jgi:hypothetical protein
VPLTPGLVDHLTLQPLLTAGTGRHYDVDQVTNSLYADSWRASADQLRPNLLTLGIVVGQGTAAMPASGSST